MEIEKRWRAGEWLSRAGKINIINSLNYKYMHNGRSSSKEGGRKRRRKRRRKHPPSSQSLTAGNSLQSSSPPGSSSSGPSATTLESPPPPPPTRVENLIDMDAPQPTPGQSMEGLMATLNIQ